MNGMKTEGGETAHDDESLVTLFLHTADVA